MEQPKAHNQIRLEDHIFRVESIPFDLDSWYYLCSDVTSPTVFLPISRATATSICRYFAFRFIERDFPVRSGQYFSQADVRNLNALEHSIDTLLTENARIFPHGAFLRLACRSPKDADPTPSVLAKAKEDYETQLHNLSKLYGYSEDDQMTKIMAFGRISWMRITNGSEAMSMLLSSSRVYMDLSDWIFQGTPEILCFRAFSPELSLDREFRLFVNSGRLTVITQYDHLGFYPYLIPAKKALFNNMVGYWKEQIQPLFKSVPNYSVDLFIRCEPKDLSEEYKKENVQLLELSPFATTTGGGMFSWRSPEDVAILCGEDHKDDGEDHLPAMRLREEPLDRPDDLFTILNNRWDPVGDFKEVYSRAVGEKGWFGRQWDRVVGMVSPKSTLVFVCDGLQRGHIWNDRYLKMCSKFYSCATAEGFHISVDPVSGAPELVKNKTESKGDIERVKGEVFSVQNESVVDVDFFYNLEKGRHTKETITVTDIEAKKTLSVIAYILVNEPSDATAVEEFTVDMERKSYNPILHMAAVCEQYINKPILAFNPEKKK